MVNEGFPGLLPAVQAGLAIFGSMALSGRTKPRSLIFESVSGYGKSAVVQMFFPLQDSGLDKYAYRCDKFTPKAFVSHAANVSPDKLRDVDMLPKLTGKVLLTKELAPIFRGREEELKENFATLIAVLDGKGFTSNSGVHGKRGYEHPILFNWLGATTPLPRDTYRLMYQLGTRLLFFEIPSVEPSEQDLLAYAQRENSSVAEVVCQQVVNRFLADFFERHPIGSVPPASVSIPEECQREIVRLARLLARGRAGVRYEKDGGEWEPVAPNTPEGPFKIVDAFKELARGHALIHERSEINGEDLDLIRTVAFSSMPAYLRPILRNLRRSDSVDSAGCEVICSVSRPTARRYLQELGLLGIVVLTKGSPESNDSDRATLAEDFQWLRHS